MGVRVTIHNKNLAKPGSWRPKWHPVSMTESAGLGRASSVRGAARSLSKRSARRRRAARRRRKRAGE